MLKRLPLVLLVAGLGLLACGEEEKNTLDLSKLFNGGTITPDKPLSRETFSEYYVAALCNNGAGCCAPAGLQYSSLACSVSASMLAGFAFADDKTSTYDAAKAQECLDAVKQQSLACGKDAQKNNAAEAICSRVYVGTKSLGQECSTVRDCKSEGEGKLGCSSPANSGQSQCHTILPGATAGQSCRLKSGETVTYECVEGLQCNTSGVCEALPGAGASCSGECQGALICSSGTCKEGVANGKPCGDDGKQPSVCSSSTCSNGLCVDGTLAMLGCGY